MAPDIREQIFRHCDGLKATGIVVAEADGVLSGVRHARDSMKALGLTFSTTLSDGSEINPGQEIVRIAGDPIQITRAEERIIGLLSKPSGIATAAREALQRAGGNYQVVSGGWKKMPLEIKDIIRLAVQHGGLRTRISEEPFVYLDKNYVRILGGVARSVKAVLALNRTIVVQIRGETGPIENEAVEAAVAGAHVVMVDTGRTENLKRATQALRDHGLRSRVRIAFAGSLTLQDLDILAQMDLDIVDVGYAILDAPSLPMRFDVISVS